MDIAEESHRICYVIDFSGERYCRLRGRKNLTSVVKHKLTSKRLCTQMEGELINPTIYFGPWKISTSQVFYESNLSYGIVNLKPLVPGHVMIIPKRVCARLGDLTTDEVVDLYTTVYKVGPVLEKFYGAEALNIAMQDGRSAGQSVPHVHCHILPRKGGDFKRNDEVYERLDKQELDKVLENISSTSNIGQQQIATGKSDWPVDEERKPRTAEEMAAESNSLRLLFPDNSPSFI